MNHGFVSLASRSVRCCIPAVAHLSRPRDGESVARPARQDFPDLRLRRLSVTTKKLSSGLTAFIAFALSALPVCATPLAPGIVPDVPLAPTLTDLGHAPAGGTLEIALTLNYRNAAGLENLVESQSNPDSPMFGHFSTN
jgi:hypothetical protein